MNVTSKRNDIQGLRAVAVVAVVLYHFGIGPFSGGFIGVDVFFVISGYLITAKIAREVESGRFSFVEFCSGRARRLLPALFATIAVAFIVGACLFAPLDFQRQSAATIAAMLGASNILFWYEAGYFDAAAILKPLLHTWSLAVELQFYVVWPFVVMFLVRGRLVPGTMLLVLAGFTAAIWMMRYDPTAAFFLTPFRMWEFAAGGLVYALERRNGGFASTLATSLYLAGIAAIIYPVFALTSDSEFPGWSAALPVAGTAVMILAGPYTAASRALQAWPSRWLGEISYSVYLVHWPLVAFVQYYVVRELNAVDKAALLISTLLLSIALYHLVEQPLRKPWRGRMKPVVAFPVAAALVVIPATSSWSGNGWSWRLPGAIRSVNEIDIEAMKKYTWALYPNFKATNRQFESKKRRIILAGDSQAADLLNAWAAADLDEIADIRFYRIEVKCGPVHVPSQSESNYWYTENLFTRQNPSLVTWCKNAQNFFFQSPILASADEIYLVAHWRDHHLPYIEGTIQAIRSVTTAKIHVVGRKDLSRGSINIINAFGRLPGIEAFAATQRSHEVEEINSRLSKHTSDAGADYIDLLSIVCRYEVSCMTIADEQPVFYDTTHLTPAGAARLGRAIKDAGLPPFNEDAPMTTVKAAEADRH